MRHKNTKNFCVLPTFYGFFFLLYVVFLHFEDYPSFFIDCIYKKSPKPHFFALVGLGDLYGLFYIAKDIYILILSSIQRISKVHRLQY
jgi:hypothetical protein